MTTESIITLTPKAITKVQDILSKEQSKTAMLRVLAMPSPGGNIQYMFAVEETSAENDKIFEFEKIKVLIKANFKANIIEAIKAAYERGLKLGKS